VINPTCFLSSVIVITASAHIALDASIPSTLTQVIPPGPCSSTYPVIHANCFITMFADQYPPSSPTTSTLRVNATASHLRHESCYSSLDLSGDPWQISEPEGSSHINHHTAPMAVKPAVRPQPASAKLRRNGHVKSYSTGNVLDFGSSKPPRTPVPSIQVETPQAFPEPPSFSVSRDSKGKSARPTTLALPSPHQHRRSASHTQLPSQSSSHISLVTPRPGPYSATHSLRSLPNLLSPSSTSLLSAGPGGYCYNPTSSRALGFESLRDDHGIKFSGRSGLAKVLVKWKIWRDEDARQMEGKADWFSARNVDDMAASRKSGAFRTIGKRLKGWAGKLGKS
jgi:hypothetical protein